MFGSEVLDVAIGIIFVFILVSIICSAIREGVESFVKARASYLEHGIRQLLHDTGGTGLAKNFYEHPFIFGLFPGDYQKSGSGETPSFWTSGKNLPSYIPSKSFALTLMDIAARGVETDLASSGPNASAVSMDSIRMNVLNLQNKAVQRALLTAIDSAQGNLDRVQANIEAWYNSSMDRVSGWYKRSTHRILFLIGLLVAIGLNINTITIADYLYLNDAARATVVASAGAAAADKTGISYEDAKKEFDKLKLPIGWKEGWEAPGWKNLKWWEATITAIMGWLLTAIAATLGAPFWFDVLNKIMVIRSTVKPHEKSPEEASEDRQLKVRQELRASNGNQEAGGGASGPAAVPPNQMSLPSPRDPESDVDGCEVEILAADETPDDQLPPSEGGVA
jgi:hypothetical protein